MTVPQNIRGKKPGRERGKRASCMLYEGFYGPQLSSC